MWWDRSVKHQVGLDIGHHAQWRPPATLTWYRDARYGGPQAASATSLPPSGGAAAVMTCWPAWIWMVR
jgi:hypothetical protein